MLLVAPSALEGEGMDGAGVPVGSQNAPAGETEKVDVVTLRRAKAQRAEGQAVGLGNPNSGILLRSTLAYVDAFEDTPRED